MDNRAAWAFFLAGLGAAASGWVPTPWALAAGIAFGLAFPHPWATGSRKASRLLLQASVVALGFGMPFGEVLRTGRSGLLYSAVGIAATLLAGALLGRLLGLGRRGAFLISSGTAICGGSAIAAVGPAIEATDEEMAVSLGTVFLLNAAALFIFPPAGHALGLSGPQFGLWAALAIHDTSSVVGAVQRFGPDAFQAGVSVKLARALWILPLTLLALAIWRRKGAVQWPWFILLFCGAACAGGLARGTGAWPLCGTLQALGKTGMTLTLFLIGSGFSRKALAATGWRPLLHGIILWAAVALSSLALVRAGWIAV